MAAIKSALVTGATGFLGSHMARLLLRNGVKTAILKQPGSSLARLENEKNSLRIIECGYDRLDACENAVKEFKPEAVYHFGWPGADRALYNDFSQISEGLGTTQRLLELSQRAGCRIWAGLGSQAEYGPMPDRAVSEDFPLQPVTLYGIAKAGSYFLARQFCASHQMDFFWFRLFSAYGPGDNPRWVIPYVISSLLKGEKPALTAGTQRWDFIYVEDAVEAVWKASNNPKAGGVFNLGSGEAVTLRSAVETARDLAAPGAALGFGEKPFGPDQIMHLQADVARLSSLAGWKPRFSLEQGLKNTVEWFRQK